MLWRAQHVGGNRMALRLLRSISPDVASSSPRFVQERIISRIGGGERLDPDLRARYESSAGQSLAGVRIHRDAESADLAGAVGARAFTTGSDVFFGAAQFQPRSPDGALLLAHELVHTTQPQVAVAEFSVSDPDDSYERSAQLTAQRWISSGGAIDSSATRTADVSRQPAGSQATRKGETPVEAATEGIQGRYRELLTPSLDDADTAKLQTATDGAGIVGMIKKRDEIRGQMAAIALNIDSGESQYGPDADVYDRLGGLENELTGQIQLHLTKLGVHDEVELLGLVEEWFPKRFLAEAKIVALGMLAHNEEDANQELIRYSGMVCSPDIDGLLAADTMLAELCPDELVISIQAAEEALSKYAPSAGALTPEEFARNIPSSEQSVMIDIQNLGRNRTLLRQKQALFKAARSSYGQTYPILLSKEYVPGSFVRADPAELHIVAAGPITEILKNIDRVRDAIRDDDLKLWNLRDVLSVTEVRLGVTDPILLASIRARSASIEKDEALRGWAMSALAIGTTILAGIIFTPAVGMFVGALWGARALYGSIHEYLNEDAANNVALDPDVADISLNEPQLLWVVLDAALLLLDLGTVAKGLRPVSRALEANPNSTTLRAFRHQAEERLGEDAAARLTEREAQRFGIADEEWSAINDELELTPPTPRSSWTIPVDNWKRAKPEAYRMIFGTETLPDINRPGRIRMTLGHIVEKSTGGLHSFENLMPQLNAVNVKLSGIYKRIPFQLPGSAEIVTELNGKRITRSLREAFESGEFDLAEQRAISNHLLSLVLAENPEFEVELAELVQQIPNLARELE